jgi:recombination protein RecT
LESEEFRQQVALALPKHLTPDRFARIALTTYLRTPGLANCDQASLLNCLMTLSQLGLEPDGRRAHLIPFRNTTKNSTECQLIIDYKGLVELVLRSGTVSYIHADVICEEDRFVYSKGQIIDHAPDFKKPRGSAYAVYALCRFKDGTEKCEVMTCDEVEQIRKRSRAGRSGPWVTDWAEMAKKTVFRRLSKWLVLSPELQHAFESDADAIEVKATKVSDVTTFVPHQIPDTQTLSSGEGQTHVLGAGIEAPREEPPQASNDNSKSPQEEAAEIPSPQPTPPEDNMPTIQDELLSFLVANGMTFEMLQVWLTESGFIQNADSLGSIQEIKTEDAERLLKNRDGLLRQLRPIAARAQRKA